MSEILRGLIRPSQTDFSVPVSLPRPPAPRQRKQIISRNVPGKMVIENIFTDDPGEVGPGPLQTQTTESIQGASPLFLFLADALAGLGGPGAAAPGQRLRQRAQEVQIGARQQAGLQQQRQAQQTFQNRIAREELSLARRREARAGRATEAQIEATELQNIVRLSGQIKTDPNTGDLIRVFPDPETGTIQREVFIKKDRITRESVIEQLRVNGIDFDKLPKGDKGLIGTAIDAGVKQNSFQPILSAVASIQDREALFNRIREQNVGGLSPAQRRRLLALEAQTRIQIGALQSKKAGLNPSLPDQADRLRRIDAQIQSVSDDFIVRSDAIASGKPISLGGRGGGRSLAPPSPAVVRGVQIAREELEKGKSFREVIAEIEASNIPEPTKRAIIRQLVEPTQ